MFGKFFTVTVLLIFIYLLILETEGSRGGFINQNTLNELDETEDKHYPEDYDDYERRDRERDYEYERRERYREYEKMDMDYDIDLDHDYEGRPYSPMSKKQHRHGRPHREF